MVGEILSGVTRCGSCSAPLKNNIHTCSYCGCDNRIIIAKAERKLGLTEPLAPKIPLTQQEKATLVGAFVLVGAAVFFSKKKRIRKKENIFVKTIQGLAGVLVLSTSFFIISKKLCDIFYPKKD